MIGVDNALVFVSSVFSLICSKYMFCFTWPIHVNRNLWCLKFQFYGITNTPLWVVGVEVLRNYSPFLTFN